MHILGLFVDYHNACWTRAWRCSNRPGSTATPRSSPSSTPWAFPSPWPGWRKSPAAASGPPHIARALMELGCVSDLQEAFDRYLGWRKPGYVSKFRFPPDQPWP